MLALERTEYRIQILPDQRAFASACIVAVVPTVLQTLVGKLPRHLLLPLSGVLGIGADGAVLEGNKVVAVMAHDSRLRVELLQDLQKTMEKFVLGYPNRANGVSVGAW